MSLPGTKTPTCPIKRVCLSSRFELNTTEIILAFELSSKLTPLFCHSFLNASTWTSVSILLVVGISSKTDLKNFICSSSNKLSGAFLTADISNVKKSLSVSEFPSDEEFLILIKSLSRVNVVIRQLQPIKSGFFSAHFCCIEIWSYSGESFSEEINPFCTRLSVSTFELK